MKAGPTTTPDQLLALCDILNPANEPGRLTVIARMGHDEALVRRVARMVDVAEYKRRQSPPGIKITPRAFGKDRRLPITNRWRG